METQIFDKYENVIKEMRELASRAGDSDSAGYFGGLLGLLESEPDKAVSELVSNRFWGGSGSFFDQGICVKNREVGSRDVNIELGCRDVLIFKGRKRVLILGKASKQNEGEVIAVLKRLYGH